LAKKPRKRPQARKRKKTVKPRGNWFRRLFAYLFLLACVGCVALAGYAIYLDGEIRARFEGARWTLPAKVYAKPQDLYAGLELSREALIQRLQRQGYRPDDSLTSTGTYRSSGNTLDIHVRAFSYWDGERPARKIRLTFAAGSITEFKAMDNGEDLSLIRLDPLLIGSIYPTTGAGEDRILVQLDEVPDMLPAGLIAVEDKSFMSHWGISISGIARAALADLKAGRIVQGGSTITQQLVKNFYLDNERTLARKAKEALMAILLELHYSKAAIMETYLNEVYLGQDGSRAIHGIGLASYFYFRKPLSELQPSNIALLVAIIKGPSYYNPRRYPERARQRRNLVLDIFYEEGLIGEQAWREAKASDLDVGSRGQATTARYPAFIDLVKHQLRGQYDQADLTEEGLRIFTTLDPSLQAIVQRQLSSGLDAVEEARGIEAGKLEGAAVVTSVEGGHVLAFVGGRKAGYAGFNRALDARRLIGSTIKPFVYLAALEQPRKYNVLTPLDDSPLSVQLRNGDVWQPRNFSRRSHGTAVPLYYALAKSYNIATARLALDVGIPNIIDTLQRLGYPEQPLAVPSVSLGAVNMSPFQVTQLYNTIAADGYYTPLTSINAVTTAEGEPLSRHQLSLKQVVDSGTNFILTWIMRRIMHQGTGTGAYNVLPADMEVAGKTGTSDGGRDAWFAGFTDNRVAVVWTGNDQNEPMNLTGATAALPIWARIIKNIDARSLMPQPPENVATLPLRLIYAPGRVAYGDAGAQQMRYSRECDDAILVPFIASHVPNGLGRCDSDILSWRSSGPRDDNNDEPGWFERLFR